MLHPNVKIAKSKISGIGLHANIFLPKGTIIWHPCRDCTYFSEQDLNLFKQYSPVIYRWLDEYGYYLSNGSLVLKCRQGFLFNHSCQANVLDYGLDFGVTIRSIEKDEELVCDYRTYSDGPAWSIQCQCSTSNCCGLLQSEQGKSRALRNRWRQCVEATLDQIKAVEQPLHQSLSACSSIYPLLLNNPDQFFWQEEITVQNPSFLKLKTQEML